MLLFWHASLDRLVAMGGVVCLSVEIFTERVYRAVVQRGHLMTRTVRRSLCQVHQLVSSPPQKAWRSPDTSGAAVVHVRGAQLQKVLTESFVTLVSRYAKITTLEDRREPSIQFISVY